MIPSTKMLILDLKGRGFRAYSLRFITMYLPCFLHFPPALHHRPLSEDIYLQQTYCLVQHDHRYGLLATYLKRLRSSLAVTPYFNYFLYEEMLQPSIILDVREKKLEHLTAHQPQKLQNFLSSPVQVFILESYPNPRTFPFILNAKYPY